ncbi:MAG: hypothetical protein AB1510_06730 [Bacillota bacterium]
MKTKLFLVIVSLITVLALGIGGARMTTSYAIDKLTGILNSDSFESACEQLEVKAVFNADFPRAQEIIKQDPSFLPKEYRQKASEAQPGKMGTPYKVYLVSKDFIECYHTGRSLGSALSGQYLWEAPLLDDSCRVVSTSTAWENDGKWEIAATGLNIPATMVKLSSDTEAIVKLLVDNGLARLKEIKHVRIHGAGMDAFYLVSETGKEYVVPMSHRPDIIGLKNLKVYTVEEAMDVLSARFSPVVRDNMILTR